MTDVGRLGGVRGRGDRSDFISKLFSFFWRRMKIEKQLKETEEWQREGKQTRLIIIRCLRALK